MVIKYEGCDNPLATIEANVAANEAAVRDVQAVSMAEYFKNIEDGKADRPSPFELRKTGLTFEEWKVACLASEIEEKAARDTASAFLEGEFPGNLTSLQGVDVSGSVDGCVVDGVVDEVRRIFGTVFADEYVFYLRMYGAVTVFGIEHTGIVPGSDMDILAALQETVNDLGIDPKYYPLSLVDSENLTMTMFFQDRDGYVYGLDRKNVLRPVFRSMQEYLAMVWYVAKEGRL